MFVELAHPTPSHPILVHGKRLKCSGYFDEPEVLLVIAAREDVPLVDYIHGAWEAPQPHIPG